MRWIWFAAVVVSAVLCSPAHADMVYLKDGQILWGREILEAEKEITLIQPTGPVTFSRSQVDRFERAQISLPRFYNPPEAPKEEAGSGGSAAAGAPPGAGSAGPAAAPPGAASPSPATPSELPPPPPPPL